MSLLEENAELLLRLEAEWSDLGPMRQIDFQARFDTSDGMGRTDLPARKSAEDFAAFAERQGCKCSLSTLEYVIWYVTASTKIEPTAPAITRFQKRLRSFAEQKDGYLDGWNYPPKQQVRFWPNCSRSNIDAAHARAAVLFGTDLVADPIKPRSVGRAVGELEPALPIFKLLPSEFLRRARAMPPADAQPTASAFSQWIYSLYGHASGSDEDRDGGKEAEEGIWERRRATFSCNDNSFLRSTKSPWSLMHNGLHFDSEKRSHYFELPQLRVKGAPLRASPDLIYFNNQSSEVAIVEIKYSRLPITKNLWPNVWAQLWCYSQIDQAANAKKVTAVGEVWCEMWSDGYGRGRNCVEGQKLLCLRAAVRRDPRAPAYDKFFRTLFEIYCGS